MNSGKPTLFVRLTVKLCRKINYSGDKYSYHWSRTNKWKPNNAFLPSLSRGFIKSAAENRGLACDEVGGFSNSPFLRKCKITACILF